MISRPQNGKPKHVTVETVEIPHVTKCAHCSQTFPLAVPIVGSPKDMEFFQTCAAVATHLMKKHPETAQTIVNRQAQFGFAISGILALEHVESTDAGLVKWRDESRHQIHEFSTKARISDATIEAKVVALAHHGHGDAPTVTKVIDVVAAIQLLKDVRDILEERVGYPLEPSQVISAR